jgi:hypothetical protein
MLVPSFIRSLTSLGSRLAALHHLDLGVPNTLCNFWDELPTGGIEEWKEWETSAIHLAAAKLYALEMRLHVVLECGTNAERELVRNEQRGVFSPFWQLFMLRDDPAREKDPFPCDILVPCDDFASGFARARRYAPSYELAGGTCAMPWQELVEDCLDLCKSAVESLLALENVRSQIEWHECKKRWERFGRSKRARIVEATCVSA